jgi:hypothetical protein
MHKVTMVVLALCAAMILPATATAIPIHHHLMIHRQVRDPSTGEPQIVAKHVVRVIDVAPPPAPTPTTTTSSSGYTIPAYIVECESGGNYSAVNPSSGAGGAYQILPSTWALYGQTGAPQDAPPAVQDQVAAQIWADSGPDAWACA